MEYETITIKIPKYIPEDGLKLAWENDYFIKIVQETDAVIIQANEKGLISLAKHLLTLANPKVPTHNHIHLDELNSLEKGSIELILEKV